MVLASTSPRRRELLGIAEFMFNPISVQVDESVQAGEDPSSYTKRLSASKARAAVPLVIGTPLILGADTTVVDSGDILGKPENAHDAETMLKRLRGRTHQVYTAISLLNAATDQIETDIAVTDVPMRNFSDEEIAAYIASGDPFDKAGGYAIQHQQFNPVSTRTGCYANVIGLPLCHFLRLLRRFDIRVSQDVPYLCQSAHEYQCGVFSSILR